ncbi:MAG: type I methionyl aminopeptidase [Candidatus Levybacteria bacterium]|nr:type I methionyl aminopeptidase [Candidatus Levybacteria bacterium]
MINIKTKEEIEIMREGGRILAEVLFTLIESVRPGVSELDIDKLAETLILKAGGEPAFKRVKDYKNTICVSTNDVVVHGVPTDYTFKEGDVVGIDCGVYYKGFNTDMAETLRVSTENEGLRTKNSSNEIDRFLETGMKALQAGINAAHLGNRVGHISRAIQSIVDKEGYSVVKSLVGHGIGQNLHEEPDVPGYLSQSLDKTSELRQGMAIAIEAIYNMGKDDVIYSNSDGWTIKTKDQSLSGLFERTVAITKEGPLILTKK